MLGKAALLVVPFALIAPDVQASPECMTKQEARAKWPAKPIYWHGSSRCWNDQPLSSRPSTTSAASASDSATKTLALALPVPRPKSTKTEIFFPSVVVKNSADTDFSPAHPRLPIPICLPARQSPAGHCSSTLMTKHRTRTTASTVAAGHHWMR